MRLKLDAKTIASLTLTKGRDEISAWDTELEGFGYRLRRGAHRVRGSFIVQYRAKGHSRRVALGDANKLTAVQARVAARKLLARIELGHDPQTEKETDRVAAARTFRSVADAYLAAKEPIWRYHSLRHVKIYLNGPYLRPWYAIGIAQISRADVAARLSVITREHTASVATSVRKTISALFVWAMGEGLLDHNPIVGTNKPAKPKPRERVLSNTELVAIWKACDERDYGYIIRLLILLGNRREEIGGMHWSELDLDAGTWTLPQERSKNGRAVTVALPTAALAIINAVPRGEREHLFGRNDLGFTFWANSKTELDSRLAGSVQPWWVHDLRRTCATGMADIGIEPHVIEATLNHVSGHKRGVAGVYNRSTYDRQVKSALARWADHVLALVEGRDESKVVPLHA